jgi:GT2 family glycosyltransferase
VVIVAQSRQKQLEKSLKNILAKTGQVDFEILLVGDNLDRLEIQPRQSNGQIHKVNSPTGLSVSELRNLGVEKSAGRILVFLDDNLEVLDPDWLDDLTGWAVQKEIGAVGGKILNVDRTIHSAGLIITEDEKAISPFSGMKEYYGKYGSSEWYRNYPAVSWSCLAVRKEVFEKVNKLDTNTRPDSDPIDFGLRIQKCGYRNVPG